MKKIEILLPMTMLGALCLSNEFSHAASAEPRAILVVSAWSEQSGRNTADKLAQALKIAMPNLPAVRFDSKWVQFKDGVNITALPDPSAHSLIFAESCDVAKVYATSNEYRTPIVFTGYCDPVEHGIVRKLDDRHRRVTGVATYRSIDEKIVQLLVDASPGLKKIAFVYDPRESAEALIPRLAQALAARNIALVPMAVLKADSAAKLVSRLVQLKIDGVVFSKTEFYVENRRKLPSLVNAYGILSVAEDTSHARLGAFMGMRARVGDQYALCANMIQKILGGTPPAAIPIVLPRGTEIVMNIERFEENKKRIDREFLLLVDRFVEAEAADSGK
jgi:putative tryptophan/tyrosine transport system substrate-binding protein